MKLEECINYLLTVSQHAVFNEMRSELKALDITPVQYGVLQCIWQKGINNPKEIADFLCIENSTISGILERMEAKDLLVRKIDANDRRYILIELTEKANALKDILNEAVENVNHRVLKDFSDEEVFQLRSYLVRISKWQAF